MQSPYHLSLLLYDFCLENELLKQKDDQFYDRIYFKSLVFSLENEENSEEAQDITSSSNLIEKNVMPELLEFLNIDVTPIIQNDKSINGSLTNTGSFADKLSVYSLSTMSASPSSITDIVSKTTLEAELSLRTTRLLKDLIISKPLKAKEIFQLIFKYNRSCQNIFLKGIKNSLLF